MLLHGGPFTAVLEPVSLPEVNGRVEENVQMLLEVLVVLFGVTGASKAALYDDEGWLMPLNAHAVLYADLQQLQQDLQLLSALWTTGVGLYPAARQLDKDLDIALHGWRSEEQRLRLAEQWRQVEALGQGGNVDAASVQRVLASGHHDVLEMDRGFGVLDFPFLLNGFVAPFFMELLAASEQVSPRRPPARP